jgi:hypothetical protein
MIQRNILNRAKTANLGEGTPTPLPSSSYANYARNVEKRGNRRNLQPQKPSRARASEEAKLEAMLSKMTFVETTAVASKPLTRPFTAKKVTGPKK